MLGRYIRENLRTSFALWNQSETFAVLVGAGIAAVLAVLLFHGIEIIFDTKIDRLYFPLLLFLWFSIIVLIVSPFRMWKSAQQDIDNLRARLVPLPDADFQEWDNKNVLRVYEIACLWYEKEPPTRVRFHILATRDILNIHEEIHEDIRTAILPYAKKTIHSISVSRDEIKKWAENRDEHPKFLFPEIR